MKARKIILENFMTHEQTEVSLPETGVMLITGPNGAGKSALVVESVAQAYFGRTLRGKPPWSGDPASVRVVTDLLDITRRKQGQKLIWHLHGELPTTYDTPTKAQAALQGFVGTFDVWRRTSVFSSSDAAHFSLARDRDRKLLLETILGLDRFDPALQRCRVDLRDATNALRTLEAKAMVLRERIKGTLDRLRDLEDAEESEEAVVEPLISAEKLASGRARLLVIRELCEKQEIRRVAMERENHKCSADAQQKVRARNLLDHDNCPTCAQPIPTSLRASLHAEVEAAVEKSQQNEESFKAARVKQRADVGALQEEADKIRALLTHAAAIERDHVRLRQNQEQRVEKRSLFLEELRAAKESLRKTEADMLLMRRDVAELEVVERVLGLRGVRAHMLGSAMAAITALANGWLARLFPGVTLSLKETNDQIELNLHGLKHEYGYHAASSGQRRRVDIAILLALSDMEAASRGVEREMLIFDEVGDTLDVEQGLPAFIEVVQEIAEERCVVIVSHNQALMEGLQPTARLYVADGQVFEH